MDKFTSQYPRCPFKNTADSVTETVYATETETSTVTETPTVAETQTETPTPTQTETVNPTNTDTPLPTQTPTPMPTATLIPQNGNVVYVYDGDGNLVKSVINGVETYYSSPNYQLQITGSQEVETKYYSAGSSRIAYRIDGEITWLLSDHLGSTVGTVDEDGELIGVLKYSAYGELRTGSSTTDYRYTGQREEAEIGLYYYVARFYDPAVGRFISADTIVPDPGNSQGYDRYGYVNGNPISRSDPSGHWIETAWDIANLCYDVYEVQKDPSALNITLLVIDAVAIIIPVMPGIGSIIHGGKVAKVGIEAANRADDLVDVVKVFDSASDVGSPAFKSFTRNNFRENLRTLTGAGVDQIIGKEAHHILPQQFEKQFRKAGIENIHDPKFGSWIDKSFHQQISKEYNNLWESFLKNDPTKEEIFGFAEDLANTYGFDINF